MEKMSRKCLAVSVEVRTFALAFAPKRGRGHRSLEDLHNNRKYKSTGISKWCLGMNDEPSMSRPPVSGLRRGQDMNGSECGFRADGLYLLWRLLLFLCI